MTEEHVKQMVERFLSWKLPEDFSPDNGITFKPTFNDHMDPPMRHNPSGTNLLNYTQAEAMVRHMLATPTDITPEWCINMAKQEQGDIAAGALAMDPAPSLAAQDGLVEALERCAQIVEQWNHRQNEKVDDIKYIVRNALSAIKGDKS